MKLFLDGTPVTDKGLQNLTALLNLRYLNLVNTRVTAQGILQLKAMPKLESLYLYKTQVAKNEWVTLQKSFPKAKLDSGGYIVPTLVTDTTEVKVKKEY